MPDRISAPTPGPSAPFGDAPGAVPTAHPPFTGDGPCPRPAADALDTPETPPVVKDEPGESADPAPASDESLADRTAEDVFGSEDNARNTAGLITSFVASWERHKHEKTPAVWLADEFRRYPDLWTGEEEIVSTANEVVAGVEQANADKASLHAHLDAGKSKASWLAGKIEQGAAAAGAANVGDYAAGIDKALRTANDQMLEAVSTQSGAVNRIPNLDGFIAEQHHADTFNLDAAAKGSPLRAEVLGSQGKNSVDVVIKDGDGNIVRQYQSKYGQDAEATRKLFEKGDYPEQERLVPSGQEGDIPGSTDRLEADGVHSKPLTKDEAKLRQEQAQQEQENRYYEWNEVNRIEIAKSIGKQALVGAAIACGFQGARILGRRVWNFLRGKENPPASEDLREFFESSVKSAGHVGAQTAVSGAVFVAARSGWNQCAEIHPGKYNRRYRPRGDGERQGVVQARQGRAERRGSAGCPGQLHRKHRWRPRRGGQGHGHGREIGSCARTARRYDWRVRRRGGRLHRGEQDRRDCVRRRQGHRQDGCEGREECV